MFPNAFGSSLTMWRVCCTLQCGLCSSAAINLLFLSFTLASQESCCNQPRSSERSNLCSI